MTTPSQGALPFAVLQEFDAICTRFQAAWQTDMPRLEDYLCGQTGDVRARLFSALLILEIQLRQAQGVTIPWESYGERFPEYIDQIASASQTVPDSRGSVSPEKLDETLVPDNPGPAKPAISGRLEPVPGYEILAEVGRGGMGVVFKARHRTLNRLVALKMILAGELASPDARLRFLREAELAARVQHPNVVQIYAVGEQGRQSFLAMEWVEGTNLARYLNGRCLSPTEAARLLEAIARGVHAAHTQGIVHRDIKPANILLTPGPTDDSMVPKITDFGLARSITFDHALTTTGVVLGTPEYLAPETILHGGAKAGPAADIFALGVILYEMLSGWPPFRGGGIHETFNFVIERDPPTLRSVVRNCPRDLDTICRKCLEKDPARRYPSAAELANDLGRYLRGEPISARRPGELERAWKWARRRPGLAVSLSCVLLALLLGVAVSTYFAFEAKHQARNAQEAQTKAEQEKWRSDLQAAELLFDRATQLAEDGEPDKALHFWLEAMAIAPADAFDLQRVIRMNLAGWGARTSRLRHLLPIPSPGPCLGVYSPNGKYLATAMLDGKVDRWDLATGNRLGPTSQSLGKHSGPAGMVFRPDSQALLVGCSEWSPERGIHNCRLERWDVHTGRLLNASHAPDHLAGLAYSADGKAIQTVTEDGTVSYWDAKSDGPASASFPLAGELAPQGGRYPRFSRNGRFLPIPQANARVVRVWDCLRKEWTGKPLSHPDPVSLSFFTPDGRQLFTATNDRNQTVRRWLPGSGELAGYSFPGSFSMGAMTITSDGAVLLVWEDGRFRSWDTRTGRYLGRQAGPVGRTLEWYNISDDDRFLIVRNEVWELGRSLSRAAPVGVHVGKRDLLPGTRIALSPDARTVAYAEGGTVFVRDADRGHLLGPPLLHPYSQISAIVFSPDGRQIATACTDWYTITATARVWDVATGQARTPWMAQRNWASCLAFRPDGQTLAVGDYSSRVTHWDTRSGVQIEPPWPQKDILLSVAISPNGSRLAAGTASDRSKDPGVQLYDLPTGKKRGEFLRHGETVRFLRFSPDSKILFSASSATARLLDAQTGDAIGEPFPGGGTVRTAAFRHDGQVLATGDGETLRLWDGTTGRSLNKPPMPYPEEISAVAFNPDGKTVAVGYTDGTVRLWDVATGKQLGPPGVLRQPVAAVGFARDGKRLTAVSAVGAVRVWPVPEPVPGSHEELKRRVETRTRMTLDSGKAIHLLDAAAWQTLKTQVGDVSLGSEIPEADWLDARAREAVEDENAAGAAHLLGQLTVLRPEDWTIAARLGDALHHLGEWAETEAAYARADRLGGKEMPTWYHGRAVRCVSQKRWEGALWYLDRLAKGGSDDNQLRVLRAEAFAGLKRDADEAAALERAVDPGGDAAWLMPTAERLARAGRWKAAARLLLKVPTPPSLDHDLHPRQAVACLKAGDQEGYARACAALVGALPKTEADLEWYALTRVMDTCSLGTGAKVDWKRLLAASDVILRQCADAEKIASPRKSRQIAGMRAALRTARGGVMLRAGQTREAIRTLLEGSKDPAGQEFAELVFLALAYAQEKDAAAADGWAKKARAARPKSAVGNFWGEVELQVLAEAVKVGAGK